MKTLVPVTPLMHQYLCQGIIPRHLEAGDFIPLATTLVREKPLPEKVADPDLIPGLNTYERVLTRTSAKTLPGETEYRASLQKNLTKVRQNIALYEGTRDFDLPTIDPSFLMWKGVDGFPLFSIYDLQQNDRCEIRLKAGTDRLTSHPTLPKCLSQYYLNTTLLRTLDARRRHDALDIITIGSKYAGAMPPEVRDKIHAFMDRGVDETRFESILIIAETPRWEVGGIKQILVGDPLAVGVYKDLVWFIDPFDLTPSEKAALDLCVKAKAAVQTN